MMREKPSDFVEEDWLMIVEALANWAGRPENVETGREERAYHLIEMIALEYGYALEEIVDELASVDHSLKPPNERIDS